MTARTRPALVLAGLATAGLALSACGSDSLSTGGDTQTSQAVPSGSANPDLVAKIPEKIKSKGTITIGVDASYAPNEFLDTDGQTVIGMDVDVFNAVAQQFGLKTEWVPAKFDSIIVGVQSGKYDVGVSSFTLNDKRKQQVNMVSYFNAGTQWATAPGNPKKVDPNKPCGLKVAVQKVPAKAKRFGKDPFTGEERWFPAKPASVKVKVRPLKKLKDAAQ